jgi:hypothetical protein
MARAFAYTFVGQHTGMLVYIPLALFILAAVLARIREADRWALALGLGVLAYVVFYAVAFPNNFYGGGQSFGNRYFLQVAPAVFVLALLARLPSRLMSWMSVAAIVVGFVLMLPNHLDPNRALYELWHTTAPQRLLPFEQDQQFGKQTWGPFS